LCSKNKADVSKVDPKIIRSMEIVYADKIDDVVKEAVQQPETEK